MAKVRLVFGFFVLSLVSHFIPLAHSEAQDTVGREVGFGNAVDAQKKSTYFLLLDEHLNRQVREIGNSLVKVAERSDFKYTFRIINAPLINAYATSGGFVYINTGLLDIIEDRDELAAILAHEIAHVNESHAISAMDSDFFRQEASKIGGQLVGGLLLGLLGAATGNSTATTAFTNQGMMIGEAAGQGVAVVWSQGYRAENELEADELAVTYLLKGGFDPYGMIRVFKKLQKVRDRLGFDGFKDYESALINKKPGLDERMKIIQEKIDNGVSQ